MTLDKFGQSSNQSNLMLSKLHYNQNNLKYTSAGDIDAENLKICNVKTPLTDTDVTNKKYVDIEISKLSNDMLKALHNITDKIIKKTSQSLVDVKKYIQVHTTSTRNDLEDLRLRNEKLNKSMDTLNDYINNIDNEIKNKLQSVYSNIADNKKGSGDLKQVVDNMLNDFIEIKKNMNAYHDDDKIRLTNIEASMNNLMPIILGIKDENLKFLGQSSLDNLQSTLNTVDKSLERLLFDILKKKVLFISADNVEFLIKNNLKDLKSDVVNIKAKVK